MYCVPYMCVCKYVGALYVLCMYDVRAVYVRCTSCLCTAHNTQHTVCVHNIFFKNFHHDFADCGKLM
jgi:hypothetical protein